MLKVNLFMKLTLFSDPKNMSDEMALAEPNFFWASTVEYEEEEPSISGRRGLLKHERKLCKVAYLQGKKRAEMTFSIL